MTADPTDVGNLLQGGGLLAFAAAVWYQVREVHKVLSRVLEYLAKLEERSRVELELAEAREAELAGGRQVQRLPPPRRRVRTDPRGVPTARARLPADTDSDPTDPGGRSGRG